MGSRIKALLRSLEVRLLLPLSLVVSAVLAAHAYLGFRSTREHFLGFVHAEVERSSGLIRRATHDGMLLNRLDEVQLTIENLAREPEVAAIRVYDKRGLIVMSSRTDELTTAIALDSLTCRSCHGDTHTASSGMLQSSGMTRMPGGPEVLRHLTVIENDAGCSVASCHFHPPDQRVLGVLEVAMSMTPFDDAIATAQSQLVWTTIAIILICGFVTAAFIRRLVHRPVIQIYRGTKRIAAGDLDTHIEVRGDHELAHLAEAFNSMVSDLRAARQQVTEWSETLEERVNEKTEALRQAQHQVLHMEKMASLGKLSATVAHELNNPINGVLTYARLVRRELQDQTLDPGVRDELTRYLSLVEKECVRCGGIVHNLLTFARSGGSAMVPVDLNDIVERSLMLVRHHLEMGNVKITSSLLERNREIVADAGQLQQALVALFVNAAEAMTVGTDEAELDVELREIEGAVQIEVRDTGVGIAPDVLPRIFEPFFSTKGSESGVGLGLAVVFGIVNRHRGTINVESAPGLGTTFRIRLPRGPAPESDAPAVSGHEQPHGGVTSPTSMMMEVAGW